MEKGKIPSPGEDFGKLIYEAAKENFNLNVWKGLVEGYGKVWL